LFLLLTAVGSGEEWGEGGAGGCGRCEEKGLPLAGVGWARRRSRRRVVVRERRSDCEGVAILSVVRISVDWSLSCVADVVDVMEEDVTD
jgi:hypothetical protein